MKHLFTLVTLTLSLSLLNIQTAKAQSTVNLPEGLELGLRIGETQGSSLALDATIPFRGNRLRADLSIFDRFAVSALHDWKFIINENFFWYPGIGAVLDFENDLDIGAVAEFGIEYLLEDTPLTISVDWRPTIMLTGGGFGGKGFGINVRYRF